MDTREVNVKDVYERYKNDIRDTKGITNKDLSNNLISCLLGQGLYFKWTIEHFVIRNNGRSKQKNYNVLNETISAMRILVKAIGVTLR